MSQSRQTLQNEKGSTPEDNCSRAPSPTLVLMVDDDTLAFFGEKNVCEKNVPCHNLPASTSGVCTVTGDAKIKHDSRSKIRTSKSITPTASRDAKAQYDCRSNIRASKSWTAKASRDAEMKHEFRSYSGNSKLGIPTASGDVEMKDDSYNPGVSESGTLTASGDAEMKAESCTNSGDSKSETPTACDDVEMKDTCFNTGDPESGAATASGDAEMKQDSCSNLVESKSGAPSAGGDTEMKHVSCSNSIECKSGTPLASGDTEMKHVSYSNLVESKSGTAIASDDAEIKHDSASNLWDFKSDAPSFVEKKCESISEVGACAPVPVLGVSSIFSKKRKIRPGYFPPATLSTSHNVKGSHSKASTSGAPPGAVQRHQSTPNLEISASAPQPVIGNGKKRKQDRGSEDSTLATPLVSVEYSHKVVRPALTPECAYYIQTVFPDLCQKHYFEDICFNVFCKFQHLLCIYVYQERLEQMGEREFMELFQFALNQAKLYQELYPLLLRGLLKRDKLVEYYHSVFDFKRLKVDVNKALKIFIHEFIAKLGLDEVTRNILCNFQLSDFPQIGFELLVILSTPENLTKYWKFAREILHRIQGNETIRFRIAEYTRIGLIERASFDRLAPEMASFAAANNMNVCLEQIPLIPSDWAVLPQQTVKTLFPAKPIVGVKRCRNDYVLNRSLHDLFPQTIRRSQYKELTRTFSHILQAVKSTNTTLFLEALTRSRHENYIDDFAVLCVKCVFALKHTGVHKFYNLCNAIRQGRPDCEGDLFLKATLEVVAMNILVFLDEQSKADEACKFIRTFKDWDSLISSKIVYNKSFTQMGRYLLLAKLLVRSKKFENAFNIIIVQPLHLLEDPIKWPYFYVSEDLITREEILTEIYQHALRHYPVEVRELLKISFSHKYLEEFSKVKLREILQYLLESEQNSILNTFLEYLPTFSKYISEEFLAIIMALVKKDVRKE